MPTSDARVKPRIHGPALEIELSERQAMVLRTLVAAYVGQAGPVGSKTLAQLMATRLSSATVRNVLAQLHDLGLIDKAHASAGRVPTALGMRLFVDRLLDVSGLGAHQQRMLDRALAGVDVAETPRQASQLLSHHTRQLGFVLPPRLDHLRLRSIHLVGLSAEHVLAVLVTEAGSVIQRHITQSESISARELEQIRAALAERVAGRTLSDLRRLLEAERTALEGEAGSLMRRVWDLGLGACGEGESLVEDLVIGTRLMLLDQPEFADPERIRALFAALETNQRLLDLLQELGMADEKGAGVGLAISLGTELGEPSLRECALLAMPYGAQSEEGALGMLGVIGPQRMDYARVIPLVQYCSELVTRKLLA
jgi:heat-inducible transcriptional repressor